MFFHPNSDMWGTERRNQSTEEASGEKSNTDGTDGPGREDTQTTHTYKSNTPHNIKTSVVIVTQII